MYKAHSTTKQNIIYSIDRSSKPGVNSGALERLLISSSCSMCDTSAVVLLFNDTNIILHLNYLDTNN